MARPVFGFDLRKAGMDFDAAIAELLAFDFIAGPAMLIDDPETPFEDRLTLFVDGEEDKSQLIEGELAEANDLFFGFGGSLGYAT